MRVILASQSPYRRRQLENFGLHFDALAPQINEAELKLAGPSDLKELTVFLARAKAESLAPIHREAVIIGSDQLAEIDGLRLDKPGNREHALAQLRQLQGRTHRLITSLALIHLGKTVVYTDIAEIDIKPLDHETLEAYLEIDKPFDCAGSYKIEKAGMGLIAGIRSHDPSAIQGLPLMGLTRAFEELNIPLAKLWRQE